MDTSKRRKFGTLSVGERIAWLTWAPLPLFGLGLIIFYLLFTSYWYISLIYLAFLYLDRNAASRGNRTLPWLRKNFIIAKWITSLLPVKLIKTADLDTERNYIFATHPHGTFGALCNYMTDATGFDRLFPGIQPHMVVLPFGFSFPGFKELYMSLGVISCKSEDIDGVLSNSDRGKAVVVAVGGVYEMLDIHPGTMILTLKKRKGFVKMALKHGADLVPVISFGDNDQMDQLANPPGSKLRKLQDWIYDKWKVNFGIVYGPYYGFLNRLPINTVVGTPIRVDKIQDPTTEMIDNLHSRYIKALEELFEANKDMYANNKDLKLEIRY